ncbi:MAG: inhibitor of KinA sporulation pathway (predicted exonuclease) [Cellvibrionaceae bacterium]
MKGTNLEGIVHYIVVDIEATCWKDWENAAEMETIEIGAVKLNAEFELIDEFSVFVKPVIHPQLSKFCLRFTSIEQADVDNAELFPAAFNKFLTWIGPESYAWYSWSGYDRKRLLDDLVFHDQPVSIFFEQHHDLKQLFAEKEGLSEPVGMRRALKRLEVAYEGRQHRGIDDARNTAEILRYVLSD